MGLLIFFTAHLVLSIFGCVAAAFAEKNVREAMSQSRSYGRQPNTEDIVSLIRAGQIQAAAATSVGLVTLGWTYAFAKWMGWL